VIHVLVNCNSSEKVMFAPALWRNSEDDCQSQA
jgi:hypothetical protein